MYVLFQYRDFYNASYLFNTNMLILFIYFFFKIAKLGPKALPDVLVSDVSLPFIRPSVMGARW